MHRSLKHLLSLLFGLGVLLVTSVAFAQDGAASNEFDMKKWIGLACGLGIAIAAFGGALGQGRTAASALDGIARNPGAAGAMFVNFILGMVLIESIAIYGLVIAILLQGKI